MNKKKQFSINILATFAAFFINITINLVLSPYIINNLGSAAYGFISLANNLVTYVSVITISLNSVASRFISIEMFRENYRKANEYYSSIFFSNIIMSLILVLLMLPFIENIDNLVKIPGNLFVDVKILIVVVFINYMISVIGACFSVATFIKNRLDISSTRNIIGDLIKATIIFVLYYFLAPRVYYIGISSLIASLYILFINIRFAKILTPELVIRFSKFSIKSSLLLAKSGIYNSITKLGHILTDGLDLLIANIFISPIVMGQLAISKTLNSIISSLLSNITLVFQPMQTKYFADDNIADLVKETKLAMKVTGIITSIFVAGIVAFGTMFYNVWIPSEDIKTIYILTLLTLLGTVLSGVVYPLYNIYTITNKLKLNTWAEVLSGVINIVLVYFLLLNTNWGIYAIAGVSQLIELIKNAVFTPIYASRCLKVSRVTFYPVIFRYLANLAVSIVVFLFIRNFFNNNSWFNLFIGTVLSCFMGLIISWVILFENNERKVVKKTIITRLKIK